MRADLAQNTPANVADDEAVMVDLCPVLGSRVGSTAYVCRFGAPRVDWRIMTGWHRLDMRISLERRPLSRLKLLSARK